MLKFGKRVRQDEPIHEEINRHAVKQTRNDGVLSEEDKSAAHQVEKCYYDEGDEEVNGQTQTRCGNATFERFCAEQTACDSL